MDDGHPDDQTEALDMAGHGDGGSAWEKAGASRGPRPAAEGVRIIGAEEAAAAIEAGQVAGRRPDDAPRFGDVPEPPSGPRPSLRFPGADPEAVPKPPVAGPPALSSGFWDDDLDVEPAAAPPLPDPGPVGAEVTGSPRPRTPGRYAEPTMASGAGDDRPMPAPGDKEWPAPGDRFGASDDASFPKADDSGSMPLPHWTEPPSGEVPRILPDAGDAPPADDDLRAWSSLSTGPRWRDQHTDWDEADFGDEMLDDPQARMGALHPGPGLDDDELEPEREIAYSEPEAAEPVSRPAGRSRRLPGGAAESRPPRSGQAGRPTRQPRPARAPRSAGTAPRDLSTSVVTGAAAFAVVLLAALVGPKALVLLVSVALVMASGELFQAMRGQGYHPASLLGVAGTAALSGAVYWRGIDGFHLVLPLFLAFTLLWYLLGISPGPSLVNAAMTLFGFFYVGILGSFAALLLTAPANNGIGLLLGAVIATATYDAAAYLVGRSFGRTPLMPRISPGKTVEGMAGACMATLVVAAVVVGRIHPWTLKRAIVLALATMVMAPIGDLFESMLKRDLGVKDMGSILPGHGGVLDRIDALLFVVPATYYVMRLLKFA
ncbi:MAG: phosphatidate cytidylyltransferase [Acidimicrobiales bacterium]